MKTANDFRKIAFNRFEEKRSEIINQVEKMIESAAENGRHSVRFDHSALTSGVSVNLENYLRFHGFEVFEEPVTRENRYVMQISW